MQRSESGPSLAASHWVAPTYEPPYIPTLPLHQGWPATHSTESWPSFVSSTKGTNSPPELCRPRTSWMTTA